MIRDVESDAKRIGYAERTSGDIRVCRVELSDEISRQRYSCPAGKYVTVYTPRLYSVQETEAKKIAEELSEEMRNMIKECVSRTDGRPIGVLVVGVGNRNVASDSLGPLTVDKISVTRHMELLEKGCLERSGLCCVSAVKCGVMGNTGIQSAELVRGAVSVIRPDVVIAVDALAAKDSERLAATVQISDVGITPGAGIGQKRASINRELLGVPVIAIGIPTVISAATLISDAVEKIWGGELSDIARDFLETQKSFFVCPKECDMISERVSDMLASAIDRALGVI